MNWQDLLTRPRSREAQVENTVPDPTVPEAKAKTPAKVPRSSAHPAAQPPGKVLEQPLRIQLKDQVMGSGVLEGTPRISPC